MGHRRTCMKNAYASPWDSRGSMNEKQKEQDNNYNNIEEE